MRWPEDRVPLYLKMFNLTHLSAFMFKLLTLVEHVYMTVLSKGNLLGFLLSGNLLTLV